MILNINSWTTNIIWSFILLNNIIIISWRIYLIILLNRVVAYWIIHSESGPKRWRAYLTIWLYRTNWNLLLNSWSCSSSAYLKITKTWYLGYYALKNSWIILKLWLRIILLWLLLIYLINFLLIFTLLYLIILILSLVFKFPLIFQKLWILSGFIH